MEPIDVEDGVYTGGFDTEGYRLEITSDGGATKITKNENRPPDIDALKMLIGQFLKANGRPVPSDDLQELLAVCENYMIS